MAKKLAELLKDLGSATATAEAAKNKVAEALQAQQEARVTYADAVSQAQAAHQAAVQAVRDLEAEVKANISGAIGVDAPDSRGRSGGESV